MQLSTMEVIIQIICIMCAMSFNITLHLQEQTSSHCLVSKVNHSFHDFYNIWYFGIKIVLTHGEEYLKNACNLRCRVIGPSSLLSIDNSARSWEIECFVGKYECLLKSNLLEKSNYYRRVFTMLLYYTIFI